MKLKNILLVVLLGISLASCSDFGGSDNSSIVNDTSSIVNINSLAGELSKEVTTKEVSTKMAARHILRANSSSEPSSSEVVSLNETSSEIVSSDVENSEVPSEETSSEESESKVQYIVMYNYQEEIEFTIELENPKGFGIDAIELTISDPDATIKIDNKDYEPIQYADPDGDGVKSRIVNWSSENPYKKTYTIKTTTPEAISTLKVLDIRLAGDKEWQGTELKNNELKIYKMADEDLKWNFITNTPEYYDFSLEHGDNVEIKNVTGATYNEETGTYRLTENGKVEYTYIYKIDGIAAEWTESREINLLELDVPSIYESYYFVTETAMKFWFEGTDVPIETIEISYDKEKIFKFHWRLDTEMIGVETKYTGWYDAPESFPSFEYGRKAFYLRLGGSWYSVDPSNRIITLEK